MLAAIVLWRGRLEVEEAEEDELSSRCFFDPLGGPLKHGHEVGAAFVQ